MTHEEAIREMAVERYLLDELPTEQRAAFEAHYFDCPQCAEDLIASERLLQAGRIVAREALSAPAPSVQRSWTDRLFGPWVLVPALAAALLVIAYQAGVLVPKLHREIAQLGAPELVNSVVLANLDARGGDVPTIVAPASGSFVLAVDIPARDGTATYLCSLLSDTGAVAWTVPIPAARVDNTVSLRVPADSVHAGRNTLLVRAQSVSGGAPAELGRYVFDVRRE